MVKQVVGVYRTSEEAVGALERLHALGYSRDDIYLVANDKVRRSIPYGYEANVEVVDDITHTDDRSFWEKVRDFFSFDETYETTDRLEDDPLYNYQNELNEGAIAVLVDSDETVNF